MSKFFKYITSSILIILLISTLNSCHKSDEEILNEAREAFINSGGYESIFDPDSPDSLQIIRRFNNAYLVHINGMVESFREQIVCGYSINTSSGFYRVVYKGRVLSFTAACLNGIITKDDLEKWKKENTDITYSKQQSNYSTYFTLDKFYDVDFLSIYAKYHNENYSNFITKYDVIITDFYGVYGDSMCIKIESNKKLCTSDEFLIFNRPIILDEYKDLVYFHNNNFYNLKEVYELGILNTSIFYNAIENYYTTRLNTP